MESWVCPVACVCSPLLLNWKAVLQDMRERKWETGGEKGGVEEIKERERNVIKKNNKALVPMFHIFTVEN